jgi:hypothetical protein
MPRSPWRFAFLANASDPEGLYLRVRLVACQPYATPGGPRLWFASAWLAGEIPARTPLTYKEAKKPTNVRGEFEKSFDSEIRIFDASLAVSTACPYQNG